MNSIVSALLRVRESLSTTHRSQAGQGLVEYAMIFLCMALVLIVVVGVIGQHVNGSYSNVSSRFP